MQSNNITYVYKTYNYYVLIIELILFLIKNKYLEERKDAGVFVQNFNYDTWKRLSWNSASHISNENTIYLTIFDEENTGIDIYVTYGIYTETARFSILLSPKALKEFYNEEVGVFPNSQLLREMERAGSFWFVLSNFIHQLKNNENPFSQDVLKPMQDLGFEFLKPHILNIQSYCNNYFKTWFPSYLINGCDPLKSAFCSDPLYCDNSKQSSYDYHYVYLRRLYHFLLKYTNHLYPRSNNA